MLLQTNGSGYPNGPGYSNGYGFQWKSFSDSPPVYPTIYGQPRMFGVPVFQSATPQFNAAQSPNGGFRPNGSVIPMMQSYTPPAPSLMTQPTAMSTAFAGFTGQYFMPYSSSNVYTPGTLTGNEMVSTAPYTEYSSNGPGSQPWYFDFGATSHVTNNAQNITQPQQSVSNEGVFVGNGQSLLVTYSGNGFLPISTTQFHLSHILYTPQITHNLISIHQFAKDNHCLLVFDSNGLVIQDKSTHQILYKGPCHKGLYPILKSSEVAPSHHNNSGATAFVTSSSSAEVWHRETWASKYPFVPFFNTTV